MLREIQSIKLPTQIKELIIHDGVDLNDEAYCYHITDIDTNKWYHGYHVDSEDRIYWHSSQNKEFRDIFANPNSNLRYEIVCSGSKKAMIAKEKLYLTKNNASSNPLSWNGNNGITKTKEVDYEKVNSIVQKTKDGTYHHYMATKNEVKGDIFKQVRKMEHIPGHIQMIADEIDSNAGDTSECDPIVYLENYFHNGNHLGISGNHTHKGFIRSKHATKISYQLVPESDWKDLGDNGIKALGLAFNPREAIEKKRSTIEDGIDYCLDLYDCGLDYWSDDTKKYLKEQLKYKKHHLPKIKKGVEDELKKQDRKSKLGLVFRTYDINSEHHQELLDKVEYYSSNDVYSISYSSANVDLERLVSGAGDKKTIVCIVHHPTPSDEEKWNNTDLNRNGVLPYCKKRLENSIKWFNGNTNIRFIEMESWVPDTK